ncbi:sulfotransferase family cytosolic 1B member 1-like [Penaeus monodon]|uniref:sulfotransferase family cytosolic 1B member 1-like n=1 Tax=Penaeus monodon TaxID=6687 RepID=UPI0018A76D66|nr:sulfotransferase family cytosolic 1B member 1-like [Penaeus monodon]
MKEDLPAVVRKVAKFLGKAVTEEEVERLADHCSFGSMSKNPAANNETFMEAPTEAAKGIKFMRKGVVRRGGETLGRVHIYSASICVSVNLLIYVYLSIYSVRSKIHQTASLTLANLL